MGFTEIKAEILRRAKEKDACHSQYLRAEKEENADGLLRVVTDNSIWCWSHGIIDTDLLLEFGEETLWQHKIYVRGVHNIVLHENATIFLCGSSQATVETRESSQATVKTCGSSHATVKTWGSSQATVKTWESSQATVKTCGSSQATVETCGSSQATVETRESSQATVETRESSQATVKTRESSQATVKTRESSQATVETWESSMLRNLTTRKVYLKKDAFEIVFFEEK